MKDISEEKIGESKEEHEIESEEKDRGEEIEVDEDRLPSRAMAIHEHIRQDGEKEMERDAMALLWSAIAAGLSMGASLLAKGILNFYNTRRPHWHCCKVSDEAAFCLIQRPYISKTLLTRRISPRGSP